MLSAKDKDADRINGLEMGADDYVTKPFSPKEVVVRAQTVLRRINSDTEEEEILRFPNLVINNNYRRVKVKENEVDLTPKEFDLLWVMASTAKKVFTRDELLQKVWGYNYFGDVRTVDTHIKSLRNKLGEEAARYIKTVWGVGYKFEVLE
ncbi:MAG: winged helix-turn-helix domain-containing protein, partial [Halanaerobiales bacterium]